MLKNYINIAIRIFRKHPLFTLINLFGLTLGLTCTLFIFLWVQDELTFDSFHEKTEQLYQIIREESYPDGSFDYLTATPGLMGPTLKEEYAEITNTCRVGWDQGHSVRYKDQLLKKSVRFVDPSFFEMFNYQVAAGSLSGAFQKAEDAVITKTTANALFGNENAVGKTFQSRDADSNFDLKVIAVLEDFPANTFIYGADILIPYQAAAKNFSWLNEWSGNALTLFVELAEGTQVTGLNEAIADIVRRNTDNETYDVYLQPLADRYLYEDIEPVRKATGRIVYVKLFIIIALFILIIACINFMNLATARSASRVKEIGVRKAIGAGKKQLMGQFISEAVLLVLSSSLMALLATFLLLPAFNQLAEKAITIPWQSLEFYIVILGIVLLTSLLAGSYPAFYLASLKAVNILKGRWVGNGLDLPVRKVLVVFQFALSIVLMITAWVVFQQIQFFNNKNLGLDKENVVYFNSTQEIQSQQEIFSRRLNEHPSVVSSTFSRFIPTDVQLDTSSPSWSGKDENTQIDFQILFTSLDFLETTRIKLIAGKTFQSLADTTKILINRTAAEIMGKDQLVGEPITFWGNQVEVIGVVEDFHTQNLRESQMPVIVWLYPVWTEYALVRIAPGAVDQTLASMEQLFKEYSPDDTFDYHFMDETIEATYTSEKTIGRLASLFTALAIGISCLGLFGLAAFNFERRKKETGIRKVLGANFSQIIYLFSKEFLLLILIALLIASPLSWWLSTTWLNQYSYHTSFHWSIIVVVGFAALLIALVTIGWHAVKAVRENPVDSLRDD